MIGAHQNAIITAGQAYEFLNQMRTEGFALLFPLRVDIHGVEPCHMRDEIRSRAVDMKTKMRGAINFLMTRKGGSTPFTKHSDGGFYEPETRKGFPKILFWTKTDQCLESVNEKGGTEDVDDVGDGNECRRESWRLDLRWTHGSIRVQEDG